MRIAVSSGKGGTGKTTVATNLAVTASRAGRSVGYLDCNVEEPNGALFLKPQIIETRPVNVSIPKVDLDKCNGCGQCGRICQYSAIVAMGKQVLVFAELCHGCGGCWLVCPTGAITESHRQTGQLELGKAGDVHCVQGLLNIGEAMSPPVIMAVKKPSRCKGIPGFRRWKRTLAMETFCATPEERQILENHSTRRRLKEQEDHAMD